MPAMGASGLRSGFPTSDRVRSRLQPKESHRERRQRRTRSGRNSLLRSKSLEAFPVVPEDTVFRAHPNETRVILIDLPDREVIEALRDREGAETVFLSGQNPRCQVQKGKYKACSEKSSANIA
jgi:hypothetical protein